MSSKLWAAGTFLAALAVIGCSSEEKLYDVSGTVTFEGKPIPKGLIFFDPDSTKGETGPQGFANIVDGKFSTTPEGKGVRGGSYVVRVNGYDGKEAAEAPFGQYLFPEHEEKRDLPKANSELTIDVKKKPKAK
jgi:hypothetical protein